MYDSAHTVRIKANLKRVRALLKGRVIADTNHALTMIETGCEPVHYFPHEDVETALLLETRRRTRCPYKGEAVYFTLDVDGDVVANVAWTYRSPLPTVLALGQYIAFDAERIDVREIMPNEWALSSRGGVQPYGGIAL